MPKNSNYTEAELKWVKKNRPLLQDPEFTAAFNKKFKRDLKYGTLIALCKRNGWLFSFPKGRKLGSKPWNTGKKLGYTPSGAFKKGNVLASRKPIGYESQHSDIVLVKVDEGKFTTKARYIWQAAHGEIPQGHVIRFIDGNNQNYALDNLDCITQFENAQLNKIRINEQPAEFKQTLRLRVKIQVKLLQALQQKEKL
jgi:hypothetical protein